MKKSTLVFAMTLINAAMAMAQTPAMITEQPQGELKTYDRSGYSYYTTGYYVSRGVQTGTVDIVFGDNSKVYIKQPLAKLLSDAWIEGTLSDDGKTITVQMGQPIGYNEERTDSALIRVLDYDEDYEEAEVKNNVKQLTYTISDGKITLNGTSKSVIFGAAWTSGEWTGFGDYNTVYTVHVADELVTPPAGLQTETYAMEAEGYVSQSIQKYPVYIGFSGADVYIKGFFSDMPNAWIKGSIEGDKVTFKKGQYMGKVSNSDYYLIATPTGNTYQFEDLVLDYDAAAETFTNNTQFAIESTSKNQVYLTEALSNITIKKTGNDGLEVPFVEDFSTKAGFGSWTVIDANNDGYTWNHNSLGGNVEYFNMMTKADGDDWLISPAIKLEAGKNYIFSVDAKNSSVYPEKMEVKLGTNAQAETMSTEVIAPTEISNGTLTTYKGLVKVEETNAYYFGIHAISAQDQMTLTIDNVKVEEDETTGISRISTTADTSDIFTLQGTKVNAKAGLAPGIYVINGQKRIVK